jgi:hypothetical protein
VSLGSYPYRRVGLNIRKPTPVGTAVAVAAALALALVPAALAGKGSGGGGSKGGGGGSSLGLVMVSDGNGNGLPNWGDTITFNVSTTASYPSVQLACYQNGALVFNHTAGFFPSYMWSKDYTLETSSWTSGAANCTATLYYTAKNGSNATLASLTFAVGA